MRKSIGFLSFGSWHDAEGSGTRSAADACAQSIELTVAAEQIGVDGAYFRTGRTYTRDPDAIGDLLATDEAITEDDTVLLTLPTKLGVNHAAHLLTDLIEHVAPAAGWR